MKKQYFVEKTSPVGASAGHIFDVLSRLDRWSDWTQSIRSMSILDNRPLNVGARLKVLQPRLAPAVWTITAIEPDKSLTWEKKSPGLTMISEHLILGDGVTLRMTYDGALAGLVYALSHSLTERYMEMEMEGLKRECERANGGH